MKKTPFTDTHIALGAKMHEFAGYNMPIEYSGIIDEHQTVVNAVGVFDVSHMGEFWVKGPKALEFVQKVTTNDASKLEVGKIQYTCFPNEEGGIKDDFLLYHYEPEKYLMVVNAGNIAKDWDWLNKTPWEPNWKTRLPHGFACGAGPKAKDTLQNYRYRFIFNPYYTFVTGKMGGVDNVIISNTGYTGAGGFELYFYPEYGKKLWNAIFEAGAEFGIKPVGLGARDTLRLEMGFCLYGNDLDETTTPLEAGLGWITKFTEGNDFISREVLEKQKAEGVSRKLCGFTLLDKGIPRHGYEIANTDDEIIGVVTSGTISPMLKLGIGLGLCKTGICKKPEPKFS